MIQSIVTCGDNVSSMLEFPAGSVDLVVTSPPFNCGKGYDAAGDSLTWDEYWDNTRRWVDGCVRVLGDGGRLAVNLPWWMGKKPRRDVPHQFKTIAKASGLLFIDKVLWIKGDERNVHTSGGFGGGGCGWGTYLSPSGPAMRCASEPILIFAKGTRGRGRIDGTGRGSCVRGDITKEEWMAWTLDVWFIRGRSNRDHPAVFPAEIPRRLIKLYTFPGETVLDPHCGIGTTGVEAKSLGRSFIGIDISRAYCDIAEASILAAPPANGGSEPVDEESEDEPTTAPTTSSRLLRNALLVGLTAGALGLSSGYAASYYMNRGTDTDTSVELGLGKAADYGIE